MDSGHAKDGDQIGTPIFRSPEAQLEMRWDTATDIWSFATMVSLIYTCSDQIFNANTRKIGD